MPRDAEGRSLKIGKRTLVHGALALMLVVAQFLAQAHGYSHAGPGGDPRGSLALACSDCIACAPLLAGADAPVHAIDFLQPAIESPAKRSALSVAERFRHSPFQSRAPPVLR